MPFQVKSLGNLVNQFCNEAVKTKPLPNYDIYEVNETDIKTKKGCKFAYNSTNKEFNYIENGKVAIGASVTVEEANAMAVSISRCSYYGNHREVKKDQEWLDLYDFSSRSMSGKFGKTWSPIFLDVIPCYYCGLGLPLNLIEVDHWFEKEKRDSGAIQAILKVFRAAGLGLTMGASTGAKGSQFQAILGGGKFNPVPTRGTLTNKGKNWDYNLNYLREDLVDTKRQLSINGLIMLSILYLATGSIKTVDSFCQMFVNHFINLVPACANCNKLKNLR